jgi:hypothetical protein
MLIARNPAAIHWAACTASSVSEVSPARSWISPAIVAATT